MTARVLRFPPFLSAAGDSPPQPVAAKSPAAEVLHDRRPSQDPEGRRFLSLHLPHFAVERRLLLLARRGTALPEGTPFALLADGPHGPVVHASHPAAEVAGVTRGARAVDARALCPSLRVEAADLVGDETALLDLALWCRRWCPWTATEEVGGPGLVFDVTGSAHLWGGEAALLWDIERRLAGVGLSARLALAPTRGAAWALARFAGPRVICEAGEVEYATAPLPVQALRLSPATALLLQRLGLKTVGDLLAVPRLSFARRFARAEPGDNPLLRLDQLTGHRPEPLHCPDDPPQFEARVVLSEPIEDPTPLLPALAGELCERLARQNVGARRLSLAVFRSNGTVSSVEVATARASRDPQHLARLLEGKLERIDPGFGFDLVTLAATVAEPLPSRQTALDGRRDEGEDLARLVDRLSARFGPRALRRALLRDSHIPERREVWKPVLATDTPTKAPSPPQTALPPRPLRVFDPAEEVRVTYAMPDGPPAQFVWRRVTHRVVRFAGPERIAPEWWRAPAGTRARDYWRIEDQEGRRFWLFRDGLPDDSRGGPPRWFVQGTFG